jgi:hypothetical protein
MKKKTTVKAKLVLHKETIKALQSEELSRVGAGREGQCVMTQLPSGCNAAAVAIIEPE